MDENDISMHENEKFAPGILMDKKSMHENLKGKVFIFMHTYVIFMHEYELFIKEIVFMPRFFVRDTFRTGNTVTRDEKDQWCVRNTYDVSGNSTYGLGIFWNMEFYFWNFKF